MQALVLELSFCRAGQNELTLQYVNIPQLIEDKISGMTKKHDRCRYPKLFHQTFRPK